MGLAPSLPASPHLSPRGWGAGRCSTQGTSQSPACHTPAAASAQVPMWDAGPWDLSPAPSHASFRPHLRHLRGAKQ